MAAALQGTDQLKRRLRAVRLSFKPMGKDWADEAVRQLRPRVPVRTGRLRASFRRKTATQKRAAVVGHFSAYFVDAGPVPHAIKAKRTRTLAFQGRSGPVFARAVHHRGYRGRPFRQRAATEALRLHVNAAALVDAWNAAA